MIYKYSFKVLIFLVSVFTIIWSFNHVNPWASLLLGFLGITYLLNILYNNLKNKN
jgi:hypothetical protein